VTKSAQAPCIELAKQGAAISARQNYLVSDLVPPRDAANILRGHRMILTRVPPLMVALGVSHNEKFL